jgi:hypothetical protein
MKKLNKKWICWDIPWGIPLFNSKNMKRNVKKVKEITIAEVHIITKLLNCKHSDRKKIFLKFKKDITDPSILKLAKDIINDKYVVKTYYELRNKNVK